MSGHLDIIWDYDSWLKDKLEKIRQNADISVAKQNIIDNFDRN